MKTILIAALLLLPVVVEAQELTRAEGLAQAILDMTTTERRNLWWQPCGERFRGRYPEAAEYARGLADAIDVAAGSDLDPWWMSAQLMQESGMNPCTFSNQEFARYRQSLGRRPDRRDILHLLRSPALREEHGIRAFDGGLAQFRWPGTVARMVGIERPEELLDPAMSVRAFASALRIYRRHCEETPVFNGTDTVLVGDRVRVTRWSYPCAETFWAIHNSGSVNVRRQYIRSVTRRYQRGPARWRAAYNESSDVAG